MNTQELIEKINKIAIETPFPNSKIVDHLEVIKLIEQLDEPQKVVVPKFVADWYEKNKDEFELNLWVFLTDFDEENIDMSERFGIWLGNEDNNPIQTLVNMHQFGYEVEKEPKYRISIPKARNYKNHAQFLCEVDGSIFWCGEWYPFRTKFTRKQLEEAGFGWVFDCPGIKNTRIQGIQNQRKQLKKIS